MIHYGGRAYDDDLRRWVRSKGFLVKMIAKSIVYAITP